MAGGVGSRFWPLSRTKTPKQFLDILGTGRSFLQQTYKRFAKVCPSENIYIVTNEIYAEQVLEQLPDIGKNQVLTEPLRRNTAPCIAFSNMIISEINPDANIVVAPSDHLILEEDKFVKIINEGFEFVAKNQSLLTLGITPSRPETGYGYIQVEQTTDSENGKIQKVKTFTEKPDRQTAEVFIESGDFFWNSGIFIWSLKTINAAFKKYLPEINNLFNPEDFTKSENKIEFIENSFSKCRNISIDNGIMEHAGNVFVYCDDFGWSDIGTWDSLYEMSNKDDVGNVKPKTVLTYDTKNTLINVPKNKIVVVQGLEDYIIAESDDILLICKRNDEKKIREFVNDVKTKLGDEFV